MTGIPGYEVPSSLRIRIRRTSLGGTAANECEGTMIPRSTSGTHWQHLRQSSRCAGRRSRKARSILSVVVSTLMPLEAQVTLIGKSIQELSKHLYPSDCPN